jgi:hypothetical protein
LSPSETSVPTRATRRDIPEDTTRHLSASFPIENGLKQGDALSPLLSNFAVEYATKKNQENQVGLKLNKIHQRLADYVRLLRDNIDTINETQKP